MPSRGRAGVSLGLDGCEVCLCDPCARVRPCVPCVSRVGVCPGSPRCLFTGTRFGGSCVASGTGEHRMELRQRDGVDCQDDRHCPGRRHRRIHAQARRRPGPLDGGG